MATDRRRPSPPSPDHDLLVRIDEQVKSLNATFREHANKTEQKIDRLAAEKADKTEIASIISLLEEKLPRDSFDSVLKPVHDKLADQEARLRGIEKVAYKVGALLVLAQILFNAWVAKGVF